MFAREKNCILISTIDIHSATTKLNTLSLNAVIPSLFGPKPSELNNISRIGPWKEDPTKELVRVGCATTNEQLRDWCNKGNLYTLPLNVIMVEITLGGSNAPIW